MAHARLSQIFWAVLLIIFISAGTATAGDKDVTIPITTSSEEARDLFIAGRDLSDKLRFTEAREYFQKAINLDPDFALAHMSLALAQPTTKAFFESFDQAVALIDKASEGEKLLILSNQAGINGKSMEQRKLLRKLIMAHPKDERAHNAMGLHFFGLQDYDMAIGEYEEAVKINPEFSQPYNQLGYAHRSMGDFKKAEKAFQKYIELIPDDPNPHDSYAELLMKMGKYEKSIEHYRKALSINPNFAASFIGIATDCCLMGEHQTARDELKKLHETACDDGQRRAAYFAEAVSYVDEGAMSMAMECLKKQYALAESIDDASSMAADLNAMGNILFEEGQYGDALNHYKDAVKMVESSDLAHEIKENARRTFLYNSGRVSLMEGEIAAAKNKAQKHLTLTTELKNPFQIRLSHELAGMIALVEKDFETAISELLQANMQNPYNHYRLAQAYQGAGKPKQAKQACEKAAHYNALNNINYAFMRQKAEEMLGSL